MPLESLRGVELLRLYLSTPPPSYFVLKTLDPFLTSFIHRLVLLVYIGIVLSVLLRFKFYLDKYMSEISVELLHLIRSKVI